MAPRFHLPYPTTLKIEQTKVERSRWHPDEIYFQTGGTQILPTNANQTSAMIRGPCSRLAGPRVTVINTFAAHAIRENAPGRAVVSPAHDRRWTCANSGHVLKRPIPRCALHAPKRAGGLTRKAPCDVAVAAIAQNPHVGCLYSHVRVLPDASVIPTPPCDPDVPIAIPNQGRIESIPRGPNLVREREPGISRDAAADTGAALKLPSLECAPSEQRKQFIIPAHHWRVRVELIPTGSIVASHLSGPLPMAPAIRKDLNDATAPSCQQQPLSSARTLAKNGAPTAWQSICFGLPCGAADEAP